MKASLLAALVLLGACTPFAEKVEPEETDEDGKNAKGASTSSSASTSKSSGAHSWDAAGDGDATASESPDGSGDPPSETFSCGGGMCRKATHFCYNDKDCVQFSLASSCAGLLVGCLLRAKACSGDRETGISLTCQDD